MSDDTIIIVFLGFGFVACIVAVALPMVLDAVRDFRRRR